MGKEAAENIFNNWDETIIRSCLQGIMGETYTNSANDAAMAILGDFAFYAGNPDEELIRMKPESCRQDFMIMVPRNEAWAGLIEKCYGSQAKKVIRYAIKKEPDVFDEDKLNQAVQTLPVGYELRLIEEAEYQMCRKNDWSKDLVSQYKDYDTYKNLGLGVVILKDGELVAGASSYSTYDKGIEIEIDTRADHRRKGLAYVCGAKLILECLKRGLYPSWDAQNKWSVGLAEKLGYHFSHEYVAYEISGYTNLSKPRREKQSGRNRKKLFGGILAVAAIVCAIVALCCLINSSKKYEIRVTIPAGSKELFVYSDEEISPRADTVTLYAGEGLGDTVIVLLPVEAKEENTYEPTYITPGMPVQMDVEKGAWFKIGVNMRNPSDKDEYVYVIAENVEVRIAATVQEKVSETYSGKIEDEVYRNLLAEMIATGTFPLSDGRECDGYLYDNFYSIMDMDGDGQDELLLNFSNAWAMASTVLWVYDYDRTTGEVYVEHTGYPDFTVYDTGYIVNKASHNHGRSSLDDFWPYTLLKYNAETDVYEIVAHMDAWQRDRGGEAEPAFPQEKDSDGDGIVYYDWSEGYYEPTMIMDNAEYENWCRQYNTGKALEILEIEWHQIITEEEYNEIFPDKAVG